MTPAIELKRDSVRRRTESVGSLVLTEVTYPPNLRLPRHTHPLACIALTIRGHSSETFGVLEIERSRDTVLFRPRGEEHSDSIGDAGAKCFLMEFGEYLDLGSAKTALDIVGPLARRGEMISRLAAQAYGEWVYGDSASKFMIQGLFYELVAHILRSDCANRAHEIPPVWLRRVKEVLNDGFREALSLNQLSRAGGVHPMHLARSFRQYFGTSVGSYLRRRRIEAAKELLLGTGTPLTQIALECGFSSHAHFSGIFKRLTGITPSQFRRLKRS